MAERKVFLTNFHNDEAILLKVEVSVANEDLSYTEKSCMYTHIENHMDTLFL